MRARGTWVLPIVAIGGCRAPLATAPVPPPASPQVGQAWESGDLKLRRLSDGFYADLAVGRGKTGRFLIDTGSYRCFATPKGERLLKGVGARQGPDGEYRLENVRLGKSPPTTIRFAPWGTNGDTMDAASDGILGIDFFRAYLVGLDLRRRTMRLWSTDERSTDPSLDWLYGVVGKKRGDPKPEGLTVLPMDFKRGLGTIPVRIDGRELYVVPDTGAGDTFISPAVAQRFGWKELAAGHETRLYSGPVAVRYYTIHDFRMGGIHYRGAHRINVPSREEHLSFIGRDVLVDVAMIFDFADGTLLVALNRPAPARPLEKRPASPLGRTTEAVLR